MAIELKNGIGSYRLLHFQPDPEDGDRVCVGVMIQHDGHFEILFNPKFPKLRCVAPSFEPELVRFYLEDLENALRNSDDKVSFVLQRYGPQLSAAEERRLSLPLNDMQKKRLLERFVLAQKFTDQKLGWEEDVLTSAERSTQESLKKYVEAFLSPSERSHIIVRAKAQQIIGRSISNVKPVAMAILHRTSVVLVDGIDLCASTPPQAITKAHRIAHTFWQYGRLKSDSLLHPEKIQRVGIILNGTSPKTIPYLEAHDYAIHQLEKETEVIVDSTSGRGTNEFKDLLDSASKR